jgi:hypothetical protein
VKGNDVDFAENFEDWKIWQRARALANKVYDAIENCGVAMSNRSLKA